MRIAFLTNAYPPVMRGGAGRMAELQVRILEQAGFEVRVWRPEIPWLGWFAPARLFAHLADLLPQANIAKEILAWEPQVLLTHNLTGCGFGTPSFIQRQGVRWIHVLHDVQLFEPSGRLADAKQITWWQRFWSWTRRKSFGKPNLTISPTAWLLEQHERRGFFNDAKTQVLPNPAPPVSFAMRAPTEELLLLLIGDSREKGRELAIKIAEQSTHRLEIVANASQEEVMDAMRQADILLFPSQIVENQPTVLLEAASVGLPVIASDVGGVHETLAGAGIIVPKDDPKGWLEAIDFLRDPDRYRDHSVRMYELAKGHDPIEYAKRFINLITEGQI
ncbi:MAG TPA: glycosyltransferase family 4 protein [Verrucomicrobiae bacterium]|nr:glycosyltransferase family 4 protein [Verrucomicrobiae bacterium]